MIEPDLRTMARRLLSVDGVVGVCLGGSRSRGAHRPDSDYDLGLYYRGPLDIEALEDMARDWSTEPAAVSALGGWGPWVNGGGWLRRSGVAIDWIYRDLDRVEEVWARCQAGMYEIGRQAGHPLGFYSHTYPGEVALGLILEDPTGQLGRLKSQTDTYPPALGDALVEGLWEADFSIAAAAKGAAGNDPTYVAGCLFRAVGVACHALHGHDRAWLINEKGMVASAARLPSAPVAFAEQAREIFVAPSLVAVAAAQRLVDDVRAAVGAAAEPSA